MLGSIFSSSRSLLSLQETLDLASSYLETARKAKDLKIALVLCDDAEASLSEMKKALKKAHAPETLADQTLRDKIATVYFEHGKVLEKLGQHDRALGSYKKAQKWGHKGIKSSSIVPALPRFASDTSVVTQTATSASMSVQQKSAWIDYLFEKALSTLGSLEVPNKPSLFLVYAHDNSTHGEARASTSKDLIKQLSKIQVTLYSDQAPTAQPYSTPIQELEEDARLENILSNQLCLLPTQLKKGVKPVDKVVVCCSEVLGSYLEKWPNYEKFYQELQKAYLEDRKAYLEDDEQASAVAIRQVVKKFSQVPAYNAEFHHVLTEMAFLEIRAQERKEDTHGIVPVSLTPESYTQCLGRFITSTTVRMEDMLRFDGDSNNKYAYQKSQHGVLFKLIERLLASSEEAKTFLSKFWDGHAQLISRLQDPSSTLGELEFTKLLDGIFGDIHATLHRQLASTVQQHHQQLRVFHADSKAALKEQYFDALKHDKAFQETLQLYVAPYGKTPLQDTAPFLLLSTVQALLKDTHVILLTGDSGAGKTTFNRMLEKELWGQKKEPDTIPLFIALPSIEKPEHDLIAKALKQRGLSKFQIQKLKKEKQRFIFILDGSDEIQQTQNLYLHNRINQPDGWQGHMVISCRSEYLGQDYQIRFQPNQTLLGEASSFQEIVIAPFSETERNQYLEKYVQRNPMGWTVPEYKQALERPHLHALVSTPFLLRVILEALPYLENEEETRSDVQLLMDLYDQFVKLWFERDQLRLSTPALAGTKRESFRELSDDGFTRHGMRFAKDLAVHLYTENAGNPVVEFSLFEDEGNWKERFFGREDKKQLLRDASPLTRSGNQYRFIHKSLLEYFVVRSLFESFDACEALNIRRRGSDASTYSFENQTVSPRQILKDFSLAPKHWVKDLGVVRLLTERVHQENAFKEHLLAIIERSKTDVEVRQTAANAITILVKAGLQFNGTDLKGIQIPGADLSYGVFDSAQLQGSDLRKANLRQIWLRQANLSNAKMKGVQFDELPFLEEQDRVLSCAYSGDGKLFAVGLENGNINLYDTSNWEKKDTLRGHSGGITSVMYSPKNDQIVSSSWDTTVRLWNIDTGKTQLILKDHHHEAVNVAYSPNGDQIASISYDNTIKLWDVCNGNLLQTLKGHSKIVTSVAYSPKGNQLASASYDDTVRLWDLSSGALLHTLKAHKSIVTSIAYLSEGDQLVSASWDKTLLIWDVREGKVIHTLEGHNHQVHCVMYLQHPQGNRIVSGSYDKTIRLWNPNTGKLLYTLEGHGDNITSVAYSPQFNQIASGSYDKTVRLWNINNSTQLSPLSGHNDWVSSVKYLPKNNQIASGSWDQTIRLWDADTGKPLHTLKGHTRRINSIAYSPKGEQIASASTDKTIRVWNISTGNLHLILEGHKHEVIGVAYSPEGEQIASGSNDRTVRLWEAESGKCIRTLEGHSKGVYSIAYSPLPLNQIASGSLDNTIRLWNAKTGELLHVLEGHKSWVKSVVYSPQGNQIASGSEDRTVQLWNPENGELFRTLYGHNDGVTSLAYSPKGDQIASGSMDKTVRIWDVHTGKELAAIEAFNGPVTSVTWHETPNGLYLITGSHDKSVRRWKLVKESDTYKAFLCWSSTQDVLRASGTVINGVRKSLSETNAQLLAQRGAVDEPPPRSRKANRR